MAETAKILSYDKTVLIPDERAGCSLAETITADQLRAWKAEHPGAVVVSYVNTTAAVKAETDICCTSSNAVDVVAVDPRRQRGAVLPRPVPRRPRAADHRPRQHAHLDGRVPRARRHQRRRPQGAGRGRARRRAVHPPRVRLRDERAVPRRRRRRAAETHQDPVDGGHGRRRPSETTATKVLVATETGMLHQLRKANPLVDLRAGQPGRGVQVHEDDHAGEAAALAARR